MGDADMPGQERGFRANDRGPSPPTADVRDRLRVSDALLDPGLPHR
jgi:hypothetical protein